LTNKRLTTSIFSHLEGFEPPPDEEEPPEASEQDEESPDVEGHRIILADPSSMIREGDSPGRIA